MKKSKFTEKHNFFALHQAKTGAFVEEVIGVNRFCFRDTC